MSSPASSCHHEERSDMVMTGSMPKWLEIPYPFQGFAMTKDFGNDGFLYYKNHFSLLIISCNNNKNTSFGLNQKG